MWVKTQRPPQKVALTQGFIGADRGTKGAMIRKVISSYREKARGELPELVELIQGERRGGSEQLRRQAEVNREKLFGEALSKPPERALNRRRTFEDLLK